MNPTLAVRLEEVALPRLTQASIVKSCSCKFVGLPILTASVSPSNKKPCPTRPGPKVAFPTNVPVFPPVWSWVLFSPFHQLTRLGGDVAHGGAGLTVKFAFTLFVEPSPFVTCTELLPD